MSKLHVAKALIARGLEVFPLRPMHKAPPLLTNWGERAAKTEAEAENLWAAMPDANVGVVCRGLLLVDIDTRSGGNVSLETLGGIYDIPATLTTRTPTGGRHLWFRLPPGKAVSNSAGKLGPGLDIKSGTGGYVVAPGSDVEAGRYHFEADVPIADAPEWLLDLLGTPQQRQRDATPAADIPPAPDPTIEQARSWLADQPVGGGTSYVNACGLRDRGLSLEQALSVFAEHDSRPDALDQVEHAYRYAQGQPGAKAVVEADLPAPAPAAPVAVPKAKVLRLDELAAQKTASEYLVKGVLQKGTYAVLYGDRGEGKTFVALDIAYAVAAGRSWMGHHVKQGAVLYLAFEGAGGLAKRAQALRKHYGDATVPFYVDTAGYNLRELTGRAALGETVASLPTKPTLVVIDTFAHALRGGDENSAQDVGAFNTAVQALIAATGACVVVIHHSGKNRSAGPRGSSALGAAIDTEIEINDNKIMATKQRDLELGDALGFKLQAVPLGMDEDDEVVTSCVVVEAEPPAGPERISGNARLAFDVLCRLEPGNKPVSPERWSNACAEFLPKKTGRKAFYRLKQILLDRNYIVCDDGGMLTRRME